MCRHVVALSPLVHRNLSCLVTEKHLQHSKKLQVRKEIKKSEISMCASCLQWSLIVLTWRFPLLVNTINSEWRPHGVSVHVNPGVNTYLKEVAVQLTSHCSGEKSLPSACYKNIHINTRETANPRAHFVLDFLKWLRHDLLKAVTKLQWKTKRLDVFFACWLLTKLFLHQG